VLDRRAVRGPPFSVAQALISESPGRCLMQSDGHCKLRRKAGTAQRAYPAPWGDRVTEDGVTEETT